MSMFRSKSTPLQAVYSEMRIEAEARGGRRQDGWEPGEGGSEVPFTSAGGCRLLYCQHKETGQRGYLNMRTNLVLTEDQVKEAFERR